MIDLIDRVPDELWAEVHDIVQEIGIKTIPMEKKYLLRVLYYYIITHLGRRSQTFCQCGLTRLHTGISDNGQ